jgi:hypothetical protein
MDTEHSEHGWRLPATGPDVAHRLRSVGFPPDEVCSWLRAQDRRHQERYGAPLVAFCLEDPSLLTDGDRGMALWQCIVGARAEGALAGLRLTLDRVQPGPVPPSWFELAAQAGAVDLALDVGSQRITELYPLLADLCLRAHDRDIIPRIPVPLAGEGIDLAESVARAVVILKGALPWQPAHGPLSADLRRALGPALADPVEQGTADPVVLVELVLETWFLHLPPADRRALFPVWLAVYSGEGEPEAVAGVHPWLQPAVTAWLERRRSTAQPRRREC